MKSLECLAFQTWRTLQAIGRANGLGFDTNLTKKQAVQRLADWLGSDEHLCTLGDLPTEARAALGELLAAGGQMAYETFTTRFGPIRPYRPWKKTAPRSPWVEPQSAAEALFYRGLVFPVPVGRGRHRRRAIVLPDEFHEPMTACLSLRLCSGGALSLPKWQAVTLSPSLDTPPVLPAPSLPLDLLTFLGYLQREDVRPIWGRWLTLTALRALNQLMSCPEDLSGVRSERQARRIPFLHYLAEAAGLVAPIAGHLKPTLEAYRWLEQPPDERITTLWNAWRLGKGTACCTLDDNEALWIAFRLPVWSAPAPVARFNRLCQALANFPAGHTLHTDDWPLALGEVDPFLLHPTPVYDDWNDLDAAGQSGWEDSLKTALRDLLTGPLTWFGAFAPAEADDRRGHRGGAQHAALRFTALGAALVGRENGEWLATPPLQPLRIVPRPEDVDGVPAIFCIAPPGLPWTARFSLEAILAPRPGAPGQYRLTRPGLLRALQRGHTVKRNHRPAGGPQRRTATAGRLYLAG